MRKRFLPVFLGTLSLPTFAYAQGLLKDFSPFEKASSITAVAIIGIAGILCIIVPPFLLSRARKDVMRKKDTFFRELAKAEIVAKNPDVRDANRRKLPKIKTGFGTIDCLTPYTKRVDWPEIRDKLDSLESDLSNLSSAMQDDISFANRARKDGPPFMEKIPAMILETEQQIAKGEASPDAVRHVAEARSQYEEALRLRSEMTVVDWAVLYPIINDASMSLARAVEAHSYANDPSVTIS